MSGGSFGNLYQAEGDRGARVEHHEDALRELLVQSVTDSEWAMHDRAPTDSERIAVNYAIAELRGIAIAHRQLTRRLDRFAEILHALEWVKSSDWSDESIWEECMKFQKSESERGAEE